MLGLLVDFGFLSMLLGAIQLLFFGFIHLGKKEKISNLPINGNNSFYFYPISSVIEHFLPGLIELHSALLREPLLGEGDHLLGGLVGTGGLLEPGRGVLSLAQRLPRGHPGIVVPATLVHATAQLPTFLVQTTGGLAQEDAELRPGLLGYRIKSKYCNVRSEHPSQLEKLPPGRVPVY